MINPAVKGWKNGWKAFGEVLLPLEEKSPEVIALMRYLVGCVSTNHSGRGRKAESDEDAAREVKACSSVGIQLSSRAVLFIPLFSRGYCLGSCLKIAHEIHQADSEISILVLEPTDGKGEIPSFVEVISMSSLRKGGWAKVPESVFRAWRSFCQVSRRLAKNKILRDELARTFGNWKWHLLRWWGLYHYDEAVASRFIKKRGVDSVVTINDVVKPAAPFVGAGNRAGLQTVVLQHGTPGPHSAPFMAREGWVWGETSRKALMGYGAPPDRLKVLGGLESEGVPPASSKNSVAPRVLVFLSQWRATRGWGEPFFQEVFSELAMVMTGKTEDWILRVRMHPTDPEEAIRDVSERLEGQGVKPWISEVSSTMEQELEDADALLSVSSSGLINGVAAGIPTAQWVPEDVESRIGPTILSDEDVLRTADSLVKWLDSVVRESNSSSGELVLANRGKVAKKMAAEILQAVEN